MFSRWAVLPLVFLLLGSFSGAGRAVGVVSEDEVTSAFLFNFARYTSWPDQAAGADSSKVRFCFFDADRLATVFEGVIADTTLGDRRVSVTRASVVDELANCDLVYTDSPSPVWLDTPGHGCLTIGRSDQFIVNGGVIALVPINGHLRFKINRRAARDAGLVLSSKLLRLAIELIDE